MIILSTVASDTMLDSLSALMNGGSLEMLSSTGNLLATMKLGSPAAQPAAGGEIELNKISEGLAKTQGQIATARLLSRDGVELLLCDVGDANSNAVIRLSTTSITAGSPLRLDSFVLSMP